MFCVLRQPAVMDNAYPGVVTQTQQPDGLQEMERRVFWGESNPIC